MGAWGGGERGVCAGRVERRVKGLTVTSGAGKMRGRGVSGGEGSSWSWDMCRRAMLVQGEV